MCRVPLFSSVLSVQCGFSVGRVCGSEVWCECGRGWCVECVESGGVGVHIRRLI